MARASLILARPWEADSNKVEERRAAAANPNQPANSVFLSQKNQHQPA